MKNIDKLPLETAAKKRLTDLALQYRRFGKITLEIVSFDNNRLIVRIEQKEPVNSKKLGKKELEERARELFQGEIPDTWKLTISAVDFDRVDIDTLNAETVLNRMEKLHLKAKHLVTYTGIDKATISQILAGNKELTKWHKVAFYYLFKFLERDF